MVVGGRWIVGLARNRCILLSWIQSYLLPMAIDHQLEDLEPPPCISLDKAYPRPLPSPLRSQPAVRWSWGDRTA